MVSPSSSRSIEAIRSRPCRSVAATISSRTPPGSARIRFNSAWGSRRRAYAAQAIVDVGHPEQLLSLCLWPCITQEVATADFGTGEVLQQVRLAQRWMTFDVTVESAGIPPPR